jgi:hypothetical protein
LEMTKESWDVVLRNSVDQGSLSLICSRLLVPPAAFILLRKHAPITKKLLIPWDCEETQRIWKHKKAFEHFELEIKL